MKAESWTVLLLFLAIIAISIWISIASNDIELQKRENFEPISYQEDSIPIQFVNGSAPSGKPDPTKCQRLSNFQGSGLFCSPEVDTDNIDVYSKADGDLTSTNSSGLHNSRGPLVLNEKMVQLLSTRGNNATGASERV